MKTRLLSLKDIESFFTMKMCMEAVENAFADLASCSCRPTSEVWARSGPRW